MQAAPRFYGPELQALPALTAGLPADRQAHAAARRAFVDLKRTFMHALIGVPGAEWILNQVRAAEEPVDLWLLRAAVFDALPARDCSEQRRTLERGIEALFPRTASNSGFAAFF